MLTAAVLGHFKRDPMLLNEFESHSIDRALHALEPKDLVATVAHLAWGLKIGEIASLLNETQGAATQRVARSTTELHERLEMALDPPDSPDQALRAWLTRPLEVASPHQEAPKKRNVLGTWWLRPIIEGALFVLVLALAFWGVPEIKALYDQAMEQKLNSYLLENVITDAPIPKGMEPTSPSTKPQADEPRVTAPAPQENASARGADNASNPAQKKQPIPEPKVLAGEIWRFSWTGADSERTRTLVEDVLKKELNQTAVGNVIPGGIQYDLELEVAQVLPLKRAFEARVSLEQSKTNEATDANDRGAGISTVPQLSWYKRTPQRQTISEKNKVQVVIWISTL